MQAGPDEANQRNSLGRKLLKQERLGEAAAEFRKAVELLSDYFSTHLNLAYACDRQDRIEKAMSHSVSTGTCLP